MIVIGLFLILVGQSLAIKSDVNYEPSRIAIKEQIDQSPLLIPELGPPPYLPNFIHQGSNYFFGMPFPMTSGHESPAENVKEVKDKDCKDAIVPKPAIPEGIVEKENPLSVYPIFEMDEIEIGKPKLSLPNLPNLSVNLQPLPYLPSLPIVSTQQILSPLQSLNVPGLPLRSNDFREPIIIKEPIIVNEPAITSDGFSVAEVEVPIRRIPPPPELPPLILEEVIKPVIAEEKKVIFVPSRPEIEAILPTSLVTCGRSCLPTLCAQNIVFERVLPNIICEQSKSVELISIPAAKRVPVVISPILPYLKK